MGLDAAYSPAANRWRRTAIGGSAWAGMVWTGHPGHWVRLDCQQTAGVWTGRELIVVGGNNTDGKVFADAAAYDPASCSWRRLPAMAEARR